MLNHVHNHYSRCQHSTFCHTFVTICMFLSTFSDKICTFDLFFVFLCAFFAREKMGCSQIKQIKQIATITC